MISVKLSLCRLFLTLNVCNTANKSATSHCNGIWGTTPQNRHNGLLPTSTCYGLVVYVADLLQT